VGDALQQTNPDSDQHPAKPHRHWYRLALFTTVALLLAIVALLPVAVGSMQQVLGRGSDPLYDLITGNVVTHEVAEVAEDDATYVNLGMVDLDETTGQLTVAVSGNRNCPQACPALNLVFTALDDDADQRRGLPPSATLELTPDDRIFSQAVQLPLRGQPSLYPFDQYRIWLGVGGVVTQADGASVELEPETLQGRATVTVQNRVPDMLMAAPVAIAPDTVQAGTDPFGHLAVQALVFERPDYLKVLAVTLVVLIGISAALALFTRGLNDLALGFGGLILGVWGVRSVLMPQSIGTVTAIDLALSWLILLLLLGLALRAALHFLHQSELPRPAMGRRPRESKR
jgi:hypothetical protein